MDNYTGVILKILLTFACICTILGAFAIVALLLEYVFGITFPLFT